MVCADPKRPRRVLEPQEATRKDIGELVALDSDGRSQFMDLMRRRRQDVCYYAFDLLWLNGVDLRPLPLLERKASPDIRECQVVAAERREISLY